MSQAKTMESDAQSAEQKKGSQSNVDATLAHHVPPPTSVGQQGDVGSSQANVSNTSNTNGLSQIGSTSQSQSVQGSSNSNHTASGFAASGDSGTAANKPGTPTSASTQGSAVANGSATQGSSPPVVQAGGKQNDLDSPHLKSFEQHLAQRYGPGSEALSDKQKQDLDKEIKQDKQGMQQDFAGGFNSVRDGMMGMIGKGQDQSVGAVQIRSSV
jgi:hypothetical protein